MMGLGLFLVLAAALLSLPRVLRVRRQVVALHALLAQGGDAVIAELKELESQSVERRLLLRPFRRWRRVLGHPLTVAFARSYLRRRKARP